MVKWIQSITSSTKVRKDIGWGQHRCKLPSLCFIYPQQPSITFALLFSRVPSHRFLKANKKSHLWIWLWGTKRSVNLIHSWLCACRICLGLRHISVTYRKFTFGYHIPVFVRGNEQEAGNWIFPDCIPYCTFCFRWKTRVLKEGGGSAWQLLVNKELVLSTSGVLHMDEVPCWHLLASQGSCLELVRLEQVWFSHPWIYTGTFLLKNRILTYALKVRWI